MMGNWRSLTENENFQKILILIIVYSVLFYDNILSLIILPLIPHYLKEFRIEDGITENNSSSIHFSDYNETYVHLIYTNQTSYGNDTKSAGIPGYNMKHESRFSTPKAGILFASKPFIQIISAPLVGMIVDKFSYGKPMVLGLVLNIISTTIFAFGRQFFLLVAARAVQGVGSALCDMAGFAILAKRFSDQYERSKYQGLAVAFISFGCYAGPLIGGVFFEYVGKSAPFAILAVLCSIDCLLMIFVKSPEHSEYCNLDETKSTTPICRLIKDSSLVVCAGALFISTFIFSACEGALAQWMSDTMNAGEFHIGIVFLPAFFAHTCGVLFVIYPMKHFVKFQWLLALFGVVVEGLSCVLISFSKNRYIVMLPLSIVALGMALVETIALPLMGKLVDARHGAAYGSVYALSDVAFALSEIVGPLLADIIYQYFGFLILNIVLFALSVLFSPLLVILRGACRE